MLQYISKIMIRMCLNSVFLSLCIFLFAIPWHAFQADANQVGDDIGDDNASEKVSILCPHELWKLRESAAEAFYHGFNNYMEHAFPADELKPITCEPRIRKSDPHTHRGQRGSLDDCLGNYSLTLIDSMTTLMLFGDNMNFAHAVRHVIANVTFDTDEEISVFEANIRVLGSLLSSHIFLSIDPVLTRKVMKDTLLDPNVKNGKEYHGELLQKALDLGYRLLKAFNTPTGIPLPRINLKRGIVKGLDKQNCVAGAGTYLLEFGVLSRLTGKSVFERAAIRAMGYIWNKRDKNTGLLGREIDVSTGQWTNTIGGIGAGLDSFYEYLIKAHVLFGDISYFDVFLEAYDSINQYARYWGWHVSVQMSTGTFFD